MTKGFVWLIGLLLTAVLIAYFAWKAMPSINTLPKSNRAEGDNSINFEAVDRAKETKDLIETRWANTINQ